MRLEMIETTALRAHDLNRKFSRKGEEWDEFVESVRRPGQVRVALIVRPAGEGCYQVISGHRRLAAAVECGIGQVPCDVRDLSDAEALELLVAENMHRCDLSPADEARFVEAMMRDLGMDVAEVGLRLCRSERWVETRQLLLDLGDEVLEAVALPPEDERRLSLGAVEAIGAVPRLLREEAVQMVLHPEFSEQPLTERAARDVLRSCLVEPWKRWQEWEEKKARFAKEAKKELVAAGVSAEVLVHAVPWDEHQGAGMRMVPALSRVISGYLTDDAPEDLRWAQVAVRHGMPVSIYLEDPDADEVMMGVPGKILLDAEMARAEAGEAAWLQKPGQAKTTERTEEADEEDPAEEEDPEDDNDEDEVRGPSWLGLLATAMESWPEQAVAEGCPKWAKELGALGRWDLVADACAWMLEVRDAG